MIRENVWTDEFGVLNSVDERLFRLCGTLSRSSSLLISFSERIFGIIPFQWSGHHSLPACSDAHIYTGLRRPAESCSGPFEIECSGFFHQEVRQGSNCCSFMYTSVTTEIFQVAEKDE